MIHLPYTQNNLILLIDELLRKKKDYISSHDIRECALLWGWDWAKSADEKNKLLEKCKQDSIRQTITQAKNKLKTCLKEHGLEFEEISDQEDKRERKFRYPSAVFERNIDLVVKYRGEHKVLRKKQIEEMMAFSKGLLPKNIMAEIFLKELDKKQHSIIEFDSNNDLKNIHLLSELFLAIRDKKVVSFDYAPFTSESFNVVLHPHYLKEYNNRWFVFGLSVTEHGKDLATPYPLDRIISNVSILDIEEYVESVIDYDSYFDEFVGVSKTKSKLHKIVFRSNDKYIHGLINTKKIHPTQRLIKEWSDEDQCGRFEISVRTNNELKARFLSFGNGITIEYPQWYANKIAQEIDKMLKSYLNNGCIL